MRLPRFNTRAAVGGAVIAGGVLAFGSTAGAQESESLTADAVKVIADNVWVLVAAILVIFMQAGFALVEAGFTRGKSVANIMMKNLMDFCGGALMYFAVGFAFAYGPDGNGFIGLGNWFLSDSLFGEWDGTGLSPGVDFLFQMAFAATAATIVSGAMAERTKFKSYFVYSLVISGFVYPVVSHWVWGGGWLSTLDTPYIDFAGSSVVHMVGGVAALVGAIVLGPRIGKFGPDGKPRTIFSHSIPFGVLGTLILLIGWYGFNPGSQLAADFPEVGQIAVLTTLAAVAGAVMAMITVWLKNGKPDVGYSCNGLLAGLVGITAGCAAVGIWGALAIGAVSGVLVVLAMGLVERLKVDDPVGAFAVHGACGAWGTIAVGIFALEGAGGAQIWTQVVGVVAIAAWTAVLSTILFLGIKYTIGLRVSAEDELQGLDVIEHGHPGYVQASPLFTEDANGDAVASGAPANA